MKHQAWDKYEYKMDFASSGNPSWRKVSLDFLALVYFEAII